MLLPIYQGHQTPSAQSHQELMGMNGDGFCVTDRDYHSHRLMCNQFHAPKVTLLTNLTKVIVQALCNGNSNAWGWHNNYQSRDYRHNRKDHSRVYEDASGCTGGTITGLSTSLLDS